jgi:N-acetylated-alpha-linked acidic dipeptidase
VDSLAAAGARFDSALAGVMGRGAAWLDVHRTQLGAINRGIYQSERALVSSQGLPRRPWFRHTIYAPGFYTGYGVKTMPGIREAVEQKNVAEARAQATIVAMAVSGMASRVHDAARQLAELH